MIFQRLLKENYKDFTFKKIFDSENDGTSSDKFHEKCDNISDILVLIKSKESNIRFGGFSPSSFYASSDCFSILYS